MSYPHIPRTRAFRPSYLSSYLGLIRPWTLPEVPGDLDPTSRPLDRVRGPRRPRESFEVVVE